jgi:hypothetical protein
LLPSWADRGRYVPEGIQIMIVDGGYNNVLRRTDAASIVLT